MTVAWRPMRAEDLAAVSAISGAVHGRYTEPMDVYAERLALYPAGCLVREGEGVSGYLISHPWRRGAPPPLGSLLGEIALNADSYYLHDLALLPSERGSGAGAEAARIVAGQARSAGFADVFLVAVGGAERFWMRQGFVPVVEERLAQTLHRSYGPEALYMQLSLENRARIRI